MKLDTMSIKLSIFSLCAIIYTSQSFSLQRTSVGSSKSSSTLRLIPNNRESTDLYFDPLQFNNNNNNNNNNLKTLQSTSLNEFSTEDTKTSLLPPWLPSFSTAALGGLLFGSDIGCSSSVVRIFGSGKADLGAVDAIQLGGIASSSLVGAMVASALLIFIGDKQLGRKLELQIASALFLLGTTLQSFASSLDILYAGRALFGLGIGVAMHVAPLFIAETSPDKLRGKLVSYKEAAIVGGIVVGYGAGALFGADDNWRSVFQSVYPLEVLMLLGSLIVPESSRWLVSVSYSA